MGLGEAYEIEMGWYGLEEARIAREKKAELQTYSANGYFPGTLNDGKHVFVFGSNEAGRHGKGAAKTAKREWQAKEGCGEGIQGNAYGIPTKDAKIQTLPIGQIRRYIATFLEYAKAHPEKIFLVTRIGCGLAGYREVDISPMFDGAPKNCILPPKWPELGKPKRKPQ